MRKNGGKELPKKKQNENVRDIIVARLRRAIVTEDDGLVGIKPNQKTARSNAKHGPTRNTIITSGRCVR